jgi:hypothetical protein
MKKLAIGGAVAASILGGSIAVAALTPIGAAFAGNRSQPVAVQTAASTGSTGQPGPGTKGPGGGRLDQALSDLVKDGTLTQEQADKVAQKLQSSMGGRGGRRGPGFGGGAFIQGGLDEVAKSIGISTDDLKTELQGGKSIADVAKAHNVDPQKVINDLVASASAKIDAAVQSGKLKSDMADKLKSHLSDSITKLVNGQFKGHLPFGPGGRKGPGAPGPGNGPDASNGGTTGGNPGSGTPGLTPGSNAPTTAAPAPSTPDTLDPRHHGRPGPVVDQPVGVSAERFAQRRLNDTAPSTTHNGRAISYRNGGQIPGRRRRNRFLPADQSMP